MVCVPFVIRLHDLPSYSAGLPVCDMRLHGDIEQCGVRERREKGYEREE